MNKKDIAILMVLFTLLFLTMFGTIGLLIK